MQDSIFNTAMKAMRMTILGDCEELAPKPPEGTPRDDGKGGDESKGKRPDELKYGHKHKDHHGEEGGMKKKRKEAKEQAEIQDGVAAVAGKQAQKEAGNK